MTDEPTSRAEEVHPLIAAARSLKLPWCEALLLEAVADASAPLLDPARSREETDAALAELGIEAKDARALLDHVASRSRRDEPTTSAKRTTGDARDAVRRSTGGIYDERFLTLTEPLYDLHMGAENMGPMLYALVRFTKPKRVLEVGAGYTSVFLLQAIEDNLAEIEMYATLREKGMARLGDIPWTRDDFDFNAHATESALHIVDNCAHEHTTAHLVADIATSLGINAAKRLHVHANDAFDADLPMTLAPEVRYFDLLWIDLGAANRIEGFFEAWWPRVAVGGFVLVHSTLTNSLSRQWLERMRTLAKNNGVDPVTKASPFGPFCSVSLLEPHKMFQNSFSLFQKRSGAEFSLASEEYAERVLTKYP